MRNRQNPVNHPDKPKPARRPRSKRKKDFYAQPAPAPAPDVQSSEFEVQGSKFPASEIAPDIVHHPHLVQRAAFTLREDWSIESSAPDEKISAGLAQMSGSTPQLIFRDDSRGIFLYQGNCLELLYAIADFGVVVVSRSSLGSTARTV